MTSNIPHSSNEDLRRDFPKNLGDGSVDKECADLSINNGFTSAADISEAASFSTNSNSGRSKFPQRALRTLFEKFSTHQEALVCFDALPASIKDNPRESVAWALVLTRLGRRPEAQLVLERTKDLLSFAASSAESAVLLETDRIRKVLVAAKSPEVLDGFKDVLSSAIGHQVPLGRVCQQFSDFETFLLRRYQVQETVKFFDTCFENRLPVSEFSRHFCAMLQTGHSAKGLDFFTRAAVDRRRTEDPEKLQIHIQAALSTPGIEHFYSIILKSISQYRALGMECLELLGEYTQLVDMSANSVPNAEAERLLEYHIERGFTLEPLLKNINARPMFGELRAHYDEMARRFMREGVSLRLLSNALVDQYEMVKGPLVWRELIKLAKFVDQQTATDGNGAPPESRLGHFAPLRHDGHDELRSTWDRSLIKTLRQLLSLENSASHIERLRVGLAQGDIVSAHELERFGRHFKCHVATLNYINSNDREKRTAALDFLNSKEGAAVDGPPAPVKIDQVANATALRISREARQVMSRAFNWHLHFESLQVDATRIPGQAISPLAQFGLDAAKQTFLVRSENRESIIGGGVILQGIQPDRVFGPGNDISDPWKDYKEAWKMPEAIDQLASLRIIALRGWLILTGGESERFTLDKKHYSYAVRNDHYQNTWCRGAYLLPSSDVQALIEGSYADARRPAELSQCVDIERSAVDFISKIETAMTLGLNGHNILNLTQPSNVGSLAKAYPAKSEPHFAWERLTSGSIDTSGHKHFVYYLGYSMGAPKWRVAELLKPFADIHQNIYSLTTLYQDLLDITLGLNRAAWHRGDTLSYAQIIKPPQAEDDFGARLENWRDADAGATIQPLDTEINGEQFLTRRFDSKDGVSPYANRMLVQAYQWHRAYEEGKVEAAQVPVLTYAHARFMGGRPQAMLDPLTMHIINDGELIALPENSDGYGREELQIWLDTVVPRFTQELDPRFYKRDALRRWAK